MAGSLRSRAAGVLCALSALFGCQAMPPPTVSAIGELAPGTSYHLGREALAATDFLAAIRYFTDAISREPGNEAAKLGLAEAHFGAGDIAAADLEFRELTKAADPGIRAQAIQGEALILLRRGELAAARPDLLKAVQIDSRLWRAWNALGRTYDADRDWDAARQAYARALALFPTGAAIYNNLGMSWLEAGHPGEAVTQFDKALRLDPALDAARMNRRLAIAYQGRYDDALADVPPARLPEALNNVGYVAMRRGDYAQAETLLKRAMAASPTFNEAVASNLRDLETLKARPGAVSSCWDRGDCRIQPPKGRVAARQDADDGAGCPTGMRLNTNGSCVAGMPTVRGNADKTPPDRAAAGSSLDAAVGRTIRIR